MLCLWHQHTTSVTSVTQYLVFLFVYGWNKQDATCRREWGVNTVGVWRGRYVVRYTSYTNLPSVIILYNLYITFFSCWSLFTYVIYVWLKKGEFYDVDCHQRTYLPTSYNWHKKRTCFQLKYKRRHVWLWVVCSDLSNWKIKRTVQRKQ